jgi:hypothetical protein
MRAFCCPKEIRHDVRRLLTLAAALAIASIGLLPPVPTHAQAMPTGEPTPPPKKQCAALKSKWQKAQCQNYDNAAPADEYFGRMKESYLGINNTFKDMFVEAGDNTTSQSIITKLNFASDALAAWSAKYPKDSALAHSYYLGVLALRKVYVQAQQQQAWQYIQAILKRFPNTYYSKQIALSIKDGFTEHWYADAQPCPTAGAPAPEQSQAPVSKPGQPVVDLLNPPCIEPPSPEPGFEPPTPSPSPAPRGRNAPAPVVTNAPAPTPAASVAPSATTAPSASPKAMRAALSIKSAPTPKPNATPVPGPNPPPPN